MRNYILRRLLLFPVVLFAVSVITFSLIRVLPGDAANVKLGASGSQCQACLDQVRKELNLDKSVPEQYLIWAGNALRFDFGVSTSTGVKVTPELRDRFFTTLQLGVLTILLTLVIGIPLGAVSAIKGGTITDYLLRFVSILGLSVPSFWIGTLVVFMPVIWWGWTPVKEWVTFTQDPVAHVGLLLLPSLVLAIGGAAYVARITRSAMLEALSSDHVRTARAKGLWERVVIVRHVFRNSMLTLLTVVGLQFGVVLGGAVLIESIFTIPGIGSWIVTAVPNRDYQVLQGVTVLFAAWFLTITLVTDVLYAWVDPRIRY